jgi:hypothetical protein
MEERSLKPNGFSRLVSVLLPLTYLAGAFL